MWLFILVGVVMIGAFIAIIIAISKVKKNMKEQKSAAEIVTNAQVLKTYSQSHEIEAVDSANSRTTSTYYIDFLLEDRSKKTFKVNKKLFMKTMDGDCGTLTFKGYKVIGFLKNNNAISTSSNSIKNKGVYFFQNDPKSGQTVKFYADASDLGVSISSDAQIDCDYNEVCKYIDRMADNASDNFFVLEKPNGGIIQFFNDGKSDMIEIDIPLERGYSYKGELHSAQELKKCVRDFFDDVDIAGRYSLSHQEG